MLGRNSLIRQFFVSVPHAGRGKFPEVAATNTPPKPIFQVVSMIALLSAGFAVFAVAVVIGAKLLKPGGYPDPFIPYQSVITLPGQPIGAIGELPCHIAYLPSHLNQSWCDFALDTEHFRSVEIVVEHGTITQVWLAVKSLQVVDLVQRWGPPQRIEQSRREYIAIWESGMVAYCALSRRFHNQLKVHTLLFRPGV